MSTDLLTSREDLEELRDQLSKMRSFIEYDIYNHPKSELFEELDLLLKDTVLQLDKMDEELVHVYAFDVTITITRRQYVKSSDEDLAEQAAIDNALSDLDHTLDWDENDVECVRREDEETTKFYDVEV
jgi:hypothetical protein